MTSPDAPDATPDEAYAELLEDSAEDLYEHAPCGYLSTLPGGTIVKVNETFLEWTGYARDGLVGARKFQELLGPGGRIYYETHYAPLLRMQGWVREIAVDVVCADGRRLPVLVNSVERRDSAGAPVIVRTTVFNATDRKEYERELLRARQRAEQTEARVRVLQQVAAEFAAAATTQEIAAVAVRAAATAFGAAGSMVWLRDPETGTLHRVATANAPDLPEQAIVPLAAALPQAEAVRTSAVRVVTLPAADREFPPIAAAMRAAGRETIVFVPLVGHDETLGSVAFSFEATRAFDAAEVELLRTLGRQTGQALERASLYETERRHRRQAVALQRITAVLAASLTPVEIASAVADELGRNDVADRVAFAVVDLEADRLDVVASARYDREAVEQWRRFFRLDAGLPGTEAVRRREALFYESPEPVEGLPALDRSPLAAGAGAFAALPLTVDQRAAGVLLLAYDEPRRFSREDREYLVALAGQCAQALERARLQEETARREERAAFVAEMSRALEEVRGFAERAQRLVAQVVPRLADAACVDVPAPLGAERIAAAGDLAAATCGLAPGDLPAAVESVLRTGIAQLVTGTVPRRGDEPAPLGACAVLPLRMETGPLGVLVLARADAQHGYRPSDLAFLADLADRAELSLANARFYEHERTVAHTLQRSLLASETPVDRRFAVATHYRPAVETLEVGGDWHDVFAVGRDKLGVCVGDVVGRGVEAASAMGQLRSAIRALAAADLGPASILERLDVFVDQVSAARMATVMYGEVDLGTGSLRYACAGHPPALLVGGDGRVEYLWDGRSAPLGAYLDPVERPLAETTISPGSRLLLYTDGLVERRDRAIDDGLDLLVAKVLPRVSQPLRQLVVELTEAMLVDEQVRDDVCLLAFAYHGPAG